jgi:hypothetical protein
LFAEPVDESVHPRISDYLVVVSAGEFAAYAYAFNDPPSLSPQPPNATCPSNLLAREGEGKPNHRPARDPWIDSQPVLNA